MDYSLLDNNVKKRHLNWSSDISTCSSITCQYLCLKDMLPYESLEITFDYELLVPIRLSEQLANVLPNLEKNMLEGLAKHFYLDSCAFESNSNLITGLSYLPQDIISVTNGGACSEISTDEIFEESGFTCIPVQGFMTMHYVADSQSEVSALLLNAVEQKANDGNLINGTQIKRLAYVGDKSVNSEPHFDQSSTLGIKGSNSMVFGVVAVAIVGIFVSAGLFVRKKGVNSIRKKHVLYSTPSVTVGKKGGLRLQDHERKRSDLDDIARDVFASDPFEMPDDLHVKKEQLKKHGLTRTDVAGLFLKQGSLSTISEGQENDSRSSSTGISESHIVPFQRILSESVYSDDVQMSTCSHSESGIADEEFSIDQMKQDHMILNV